jgi:hypothetical protein
VRHHLLAFQHRDQLSILNLFCPNFYLKHKAWQLLELRSHLKVE